MAAAAPAPPLLFAAAPGVLAWLAPDVDARHAVAAQLLTASEARLATHGAAWRALTLSAPFLLVRRFRAAS